MRIRKRKTIGTRLHHVYFWLWDYMYDSFPESTWEILSKFEELAKWLLCKIYGHEPVPDQCSKPEHDYCAWCNKSTPGLANVETS